MARKVSSHNLCNRTSYLITIIDRNATGFVKRKDITERLAGKPICKGEVKKGSFVGDVFSDGESGGWGETLAFAEPLGETVSSEGPMVGVSSV